MARDPKRPGYRIVLALGKLWRKLGGLFGRHPRGQHVDARRHERAKYLLDCRGGLALGEDHLGKAAAAVAIEVDLGLAHVGDPVGLRVADELFDRQLAGEQLSGQSLKFMCVHASMVSNPSHGEKHRGT